MSTDHRGALDYITTSFCDQCWEKQLTEEEEKESHKQREMELGKKKVDKMIEHVRGLQSTEQVPIAYVLNRLMDEIRFERDLKRRVWFYGYLTDCMVQDLELVKAKRSPKQRSPRWLCNKSRVDAMDFKLWFSYARSGYIPTPPRWKPGVASIIPS
ncbi:hypothetical protein MMC07_008147 [Pseudocyphellaria aurata]|nr:hypothetical protein [Pseudocyphellaria aurata]